MIYKLLVILTIFWAIPTHSIKLNTNSIGIKQFTITSTKLNPKKSHKRSIDCHHLGIQWEQKHYNLCLNLWNGVNGDFISRDARILTANSTEHSFEDLNISLVKGHVLDHENSSSIDGFLDNWVFYGRIIVEHIVLYVENVNNFPEILKEKMMKNDTDLSIVYRSLKDLNKHISNRELKYDKNEGNLCSLMIIVDNSFYKLEARSNLNNAVSTVLSSIIRVNAIFRSTDFDNDGRPDNIGFKVMYMMVNTDETSFIIPYTFLAMNSDYFIKKLTYMDALKKVCLGILFTAQTFTDSVIGISYTALDNITVSGRRMLLSGGICKHGHQNMNVVAITYFDMSHKRLLQALCDFSLAHEVGHSFGSRHDAGRCEGYIMSSLTPQDITQYTYSFSPCSTQQMIKVIMARRDTCFEHDQSTFCGNGLVEEDEECDCGSIYRCHYIDHCCIKPIDQKGCKVNRKLGFTCHPSQGLCCTPDCLIRNISYTGLSCNSFQQKCNSDSTGSCGVGGMCNKNGECHSYECTRIGLEECPCPTKTNVKICCICCKLNKSCIPAREATFKKIHRNTSRIRAVQNYQQTYKFRPGPNDVTQLICHEQHCVHIGHRMFAVNEFCVFKGGLGICRSNGRCEIALQVFPQLPMPASKLVKSLDSSGNYIVLNYVMFVSLTVYVVSNSVISNIF